MAATYFMRLCTQVLHSLMGGLALFCLYYAITLSEYPQLASLCWYLVKHALFWGGLASALLYVQLKYLER
jgi:hypothetical protein